MRTVQPSVSVEPLVLLVEDDVDTRDSIKELLIAEGYSVDVATNGEEALARLQSAPLPALVLLDLMMPVMDGQTLLARLGAFPELAALTIVVTTASVINEATSTLKFPLLRKPIDPDALLRIVELYAPRLWDEDEPVTDATAFRSEAPSPGRDTSKHLCIVCGSSGQARCAGCGEAFCRACLDAGPDGRCARCYSLSFPLKKDAP